MTSYEQLLEKGLNELPARGEGTERFTIEKVKGHIEGNKTILINLRKIAKDMDRNFDHLLKYLLRELASPGKVVGERVVLGTKVAASVVNKKIAKYASEFVYCSECSKPDTKIVEEKGVNYLRCS